MNSDYLICTRHEEIINICEEQLALLPPELEAPVEYLDVYEALREIREEARKALESGQSMENRLIEYSSAIKSLGFERVRKGEK